MAGVRDQLLANRDLIYSLAVQQQRPLSQVAAALEQRGVKASVPTLSRFVRDVFPVAERTAPPAPAAPPQEPPPAPRQPPPPPPPVGVNVDALMGDVLAELEGARVEMREGLAQLAGKTAVATAEVQEMGKAVEELVEIGTRPAEPAASIQWGSTREAVKRIWRSALFFTGCAWLAVIAGVSWLLPGVASAFLTTLGVESQTVTHTIALPGPERVRVERIEVPVPGPERVRVERVEVPGPVRVETKIERVQVPVPGPERVKIERVEVPGQCSAKPLYSVPEASETAKLDAACDALASARRSGITPSRQALSIVPTPPAPIAAPQSAPPAAVISLPPVQSKPVAATPPPPPPLNVFGDRWFDLSLDISERVRNLDFFASFCRATTIIMDDTSGVQINKEETNYLLDATVKCRDAGIGKIASSWNDNTASRASHRPANRKSGEKPMPPTVNDIFIAMSFDIVCKGIGNYQRLKKEKISQNWICDQVDEWRRFGMLVGPTIR